MRQTFLFSHTLDVPGPKCCDCSPVSPAPGAFSEIWQEARTQKGDLCPSAAEELNGLCCAIQQAEDAEAQVLPLQLLSGSGGQRLSPILDPAQDVLLCPGPSALFFLRPILEQVSLLSVPRLLTPCLCWLLFQSQFPPNALGSLPSSFIFPKFTIPGSLSSFSHSTSLTCFPHQVLVPDYLSLKLTLILKVLAHQEGLVWGALF